jgi:hypothetical protein
MKNDSNVFRECWLGATPNRATRGMAVVWKDNVCRISSRCGAAVMGLCFAAADLFFLSSREDPFPTAVPKVMACGFRWKRLVVRFEWAWAASSFPTMTSAVKVLPQRAEPRRSGRGGPARAGEHRALGRLSHNADNLIDVLLSSFSSKVT